MKKLLLVIPILLLCGCELIDSERDRDEAIEDCINAGGTPYVENYDNSRLRPIVHCKFDKE